MAFKNKTPWFNWILSTYHLILINLTRIQGEDSQFPNREILQLYNTLASTTVLPQKSPLGPSCGNSAPLLIGAPSRRILHIHVHNSLFQDSFSCGMCFQITETYVTKTRKSLSVTQNAIVVGHCQNCDKDSLVSYQPNKRSRNITYKAINCPTERRGYNSISLCLVKSSIKQAKIQILNAIIPTVSVRVILDGRLQCLKHSTDNFFLLQENRELPSSLVVALTSLTGETIWQTIHMRKEEEGEEVIELGVQYTGVTRVGTSMPINNCQTEETLSNAKVVVPRWLSEKKSVELTIRQVKDTKEDQKTLLPEIEIYKSPFYEQRMYRKYETSKRKTWLYFHINGANVASIDSKIFVESCDRKTELPSGKFEWKNFIRDGCYTDRESATVRSDLNGGRGIKRKARLFLMRSHVRCVITLCSPGSAGPKCTPVCPHMGKWTHFKVANGVQVRNKRSSNMTSDNDTESRHTERRERASRFSSDDAKYVIWFLLGAAAAVIIGVLYCLWRKKVAFRSIAAQAMPGKRRQEHYITKGPTLPPSFTKL